MKKLLTFLLLAILTFASCDKDNDEITYKYSISNKTDKDIIAIVLYSFQEEYIIAKTKCPKVKNEMSLKNIIILPLSKCIKAVK